MTAVLHLYDHTAQLDVVKDWILEHDAEIMAMEGALPDELATLLAEAEGSFKEKAERVALYIRELLSSAKAVKEEEQRLAQRVRHYSSAADGLKRYLQSEMERAEIPKVEGKLVTVRLQKSPPAVVGTAAQDDLALLCVAGDNCVVHVPSSYRLDARAYIEAWKSGKEPTIPGVDVVQGTHLRIQ